MQNDHSKQGKVRKFRLVRGNPLVTNGINVVHSPLADIGAQSLIHQAR